MLKRTIYFLGITLLLFLNGCSYATPPAVRVDASDAKINYLKDVKPILDRRCVSCHSCYNSPCQAKMSSFEGVDRGASKLLVYDAMRLNAVDPTRLFIDAQTTNEWREKDFYSLTQNFDANQSHNDSIMMQMIHDKKVNPELVGEYEPEYDDLICPKNPEEMGEYLGKKPNHGMPYGFPQIKEKEYQTLAGWLKRGAKGPSELEQKEITSPSAKAAKEIKKWEKFLNTPDAKHAMSARYLYEHLYLAHWSFKVAPKEFYEIVRSKTPSPKPIDLIVSTRPFDDPKIDKFYYRLQRIHSTIVHKTHMVVKFDDAKLKRIKELFIKPKWVEEPHRMGYETKMSANPFIAYYQIPAKSRYQFMLDNSHYIMMTFIRGPVCRGQMALNVIHDHFWITFQDPEYDATLKNSSFLLLQSDNLSLPIQSVTERLMETFTDKYREKYEQYYYAKQNLYNATYPNGLGIEGIWKGNTKEDAPAITIYRHFDSASVHKGVLGKTPRTMWVIDYPQFERIYYSLVAGYDVFGNLSHQTKIRRYADFLRIEAELNFLSYMPKNRRLDMFKSWYIGDSDARNTENLFLNRPTKIDYESEFPKSEFLERVVNSHVLKETGIAFDDMNYHSPGDALPKMPKEFNTLEDIKNGARSLTEPVTGFINHVTDNGLNVMLVRIKMPDGSSHVKSLVVNRWHDNVNSLFNGEQSNPAKDTLDIIDEPIGSYPNVFINVRYDELPDFFDLLKNFDYSDKYLTKFKKYFVSRADDNFWETYDWFQNYFNELDPINSGLYDLNRYHRKVW